MTTEFAMLPIKAGSNIEDPNSPEGKIMLEAMNTMLDQPGAQRIYYGLEVENPSTLRFFIDWDTVESHIAFTKSDAYGPMMRSLKPIMDGAAMIKHVQVDPFPPTQALSDTNSPITEVLMIHFDPSVSQSVKDSFVQAVHEAVQEAFKPASGFRGISSGWSIESDIPNPEKDGAKSKVFVSFVGWASIEAHTTFTGLPSTKELVGKVFTHEGIQGRTRFHVKCREVQANVGGGVGASQRGATGPGTAGDPQEEVLNR